MNKLLKDLLKGKKMILIIAALAAGLLLLSLVSSDTEDKGEKAASASEYKAALEDELEELCSSLDGVGRCRVSVSLKQKEKSHYYGNDGDGEYEVLGVIILCRGAGSASVRAELTKLFTSLYGISSTRIAILKLN